LFIVSILEFLSVNSLFPSIITYVSKFRYDCNPHRDYNDIETRDKLGTFRETKKAENSRGTLERLTSLEARSRNIDVINLYCGYLERFLL